MKLHYLAVGYGVVKRSWMLVSILLLLSAAALAQEVVSNEPEEPLNLSSAVYSPRVAELFWERAQNPLTQYDVFRDDALVSEAQFGISYFDAALQPAQSYTYSVVAVYPTGERSETASIVVTTSAENDTGQGSVPAPQGLRATVYSPSVAELFWDRAAEPLTQYDVFRNNVLVSQKQFGISYFDPAVNSGEVIEYSVVAVDAQGRRSNAVTVKINNENSQIQPENLSIAVYSNSAAELFWDRQGAGQRFVVLRDGIELGSTDGTSYFDDSLAGPGNYTYEVFSVSTNNERSEPAVIMAVVGEAQPPASANDNIITLDNALSILQEVLLFADGDPFEPMIEEAKNISTPIVASALAELTGNPAPASGITLIEGTNGGVTETNAGGLNGGLYTCDAGGEAALPAFLSFESGMGYIAEFSDCVLTGGKYSGMYQLVTPVPRSNNLGNDSLSDWQADRSDGTMYRVNSYRQGGFTQTAFRQPVTFFLSVIDFESILDGESTSIEILLGESGSRFGRGLDFDQRAENGAPLERDFAERSLDVSFDLRSPIASQQRLEVEIELAFDFAGIENPDFRWQTGKIRVSALDGSELLLQPVSEGSGEIWRLSVDDGFIDVPHDDVFSL